MKLIKSLLTLVLIIAIGIFVYFKVYKVEEERKIREAEERELIRFDLDNIKSFTLVRPDSSITFERGVGRIWNITAPVKSEADKDPIYTLFFSLDRSDILIEVDNNPEDLSVYELAKPDYYMAMNYVTGESDTIFVGSYTPDRTMSYVCFASENRVLAVERKLTDIMKQPIASYRSRSILNVLADDIIGIEIIRTEGDANKIVLAHNDITWFMMEPYYHLADQKNISDLAKEINKSQIMTREEEKTDDLAKYGLNNPSVIFNITLKYGMPNKMILIGNKISEPGLRHLWYAKRFDNDLIFSLNNSLLILLNRVTTWFIDKQPIKFNREIVNKIVLDTAGQPITFSKDSQKNWSVISPIDKNVQQETISRIFSISAFLMIRDMYSLEPTEKDLANSGLDKPQTVLSFYQDDRLLTEIYYGKSFATEQQNTYVTSNLSPIIYVSASRVVLTVNNVLEDVFGD
ncbi:DUF4340 domain-containing protein [Candidatus Latescibacterota bacterium]